MARTSTRKNVDEVTAISDHEVTEASEDRRGRGRGRGRAGGAAQEAAPQPEWATDSEIAPSSVRSRQDCLG